MEANEAQLNSFKEAAHQAGLNQKQFEAVFGKMSEASKAQQEQMMAQMQEQMQGLRGEWGLAFDQNLTMVEKVKQDFFPHLDVPARDLDPATLRALYTIGKRMGGEGAQMTKEPGSSGAMTPNDAEAAIGEIMSNRQHAYWNPSHPGHKAAVQRVIKLHEYKNGAV
jgi:hypothetical protein